MIVPRCDPSRTLLPPLPPRYLDAAARARRGARSVHGRRQRRGIAGLRRDGAAATARCGGAARAERAAVGNSGPGRRNGASRPRGGRRRGGSSRRMRRAASLGAPALDGGLASDREARARMPKKASRAPAVPTRSPAIHVPTPPPREAFLRKRLRRNVY